MQSLKETTLANLREMVKLQRAAHDSMFKFSVKKMWPLSLFAPQVDWIRITRMMGNLQTACKEQKQFLAKEKPNAPEPDLTFLNLLPDYLNFLSESASLLGEAATYRQDVLEKKRKFVFKDWNLILKKYNETGDNMAKAGIALHKAY